MRNFRCDYSQRKNRNASYLNVPNSHLHVMILASTKKASNNPLSCLAASYKKHISPERLHFLCPPNSGVCMVSSFHKGQWCSWESPTPLHQIFLQYSITSLFCSPHSTWSSASLCSSQSYWPHHLLPPHPWTYSTRLYFIFFSPSELCHSWSSIYILIKPPVRLHYSKFSFFSRTIDP